MNSKETIAIFCIFTLLSLCGSQNVDHTKRDIIPEFETENLTISYVETGEKMNSQEVWYSEAIGPTKDDLDKLADERTICNDKLAALNLQDVANEEKNKLASDAKVQAMWGSILQDLPAPQLTVKPLIKLQDTCPERRYRLYYYWEKTYTRICKVIRPTYQPVTYARCLTRTCCPYTLNTFTKCLPGGWTRHRFLVLCYNIHKPYNYTWNVVQRWFPQCCDCYKYTWYHTITSEQ